MAMQILELALATRTYSVRVEMFRQVRRGGNCMLCCDY